MIIKFFSKRSTISAILVIASSTLLYFNQIYISYYLALIFSIMNYFNLRYKTDPKDLLAKQQSISIMMLFTIVLTMLSGITYLDLHISDLNLKNIYILIIMLLIQILAYIVSTMGSLVLTINRLTVSRKEYLYFVINTILLISISISAYSQLFDYFEYILTQIII